MDNITQGVIGGSIYTLITGKHQAKYMWLGALIANIPDFDVFVARIVTDDALGQMFFHRGIMHSFVFNIALCLILAYVLYKSDSQVGYWRYFVGSLASIVCGHLFIDGMTSYGMRYFLPWVDTVYSRDNMFVIDIGMWMITIFGLIMYHLRPIFQKRIAIAILSIVGLYIVTSMSIRSLIDTQMHTDFVQTYPEIQVLEHRTFAEPLQIFLWRQIVRTSTGYYEGYKSLWDRQDLTQWQWIAQDMTGSQLVDTLRAGDNKLARDLNHVIHFTRGRYQIVPTDQGYLIYNLVFARINGWDSNQPRMFVFDLIAQQTGLITRPSYHVVVDRSIRRGSISWSMWYELWDRVRGQVSPKNYEGQG